MFFFANSALSFLITSSPAACFVFSMIYFSHHWFLSSSFAFTFFTQSSFNLSTFIFTALARDAATSFPSVIFASHAAISLSVACFACFASFLAVIAMP
jgi:hypothetical protein